MGAWEATLRLIEASQQYSTMKRLGSELELRWRMVEIESRKPVTIFRVLDRDGLLIGKVVQPKAAPVVGWGAGTVLLISTCHSRLSAAHPAGPAAGR